jgi:hypothetical protein
MPRDAFGDEVDSSVPTGPRLPTSSPSPNLPPPGAPMGLSNSSSGWAPVSTVQREESAATSSGDRNRPLGPPMYLLVVAGLCVVVSVLLGIVGHGKPALAIAGWVIGGFLSVGLLALFTMRDSMRRADAWYMASDFANTLRSLLVAAAVVAVALNAFQFADWTSRR